MNKKISGLVLFILLLTVIFFVLAKKHNSSIEKLFSKQFTQGLNFITQINAMNIKKIIEEKLLNLKTVAYFTAKTCDCSKTELIKSTLKELFQDNEDSLYGIYSKNAQIEFLNNNQNFSFTLPDKAIKAINSGEVYIGVITAKEKKSKEDHFLLITQPFQENNNSYGGLFQIYRHTSIFDKSTTIQQMTKRSAELNNAEKDDIDKQFAVNNISNIKIVHTSRVFSINDNYLRLDFNVDTSSLIDSFHNMREYTNFFTSFTLAVIYLLWAGLIYYLVKGKNKLEKTVNERTQKIFELKNRFKELFELIPDYVAAHDFNGKIIESNRAMQALSINFEEANISDFIQEKEKYFELISELTENNPVDIGEFTLINRDEQINVMITIKIVNTAGNKYYLSILKDTTELKKFQQLFYESQKLEAIGTLTSGLSHDFKNILQNINIYNQLINNSTNINEIKSYSENLNEILKDAHDYIAGLLGFFKDKRKGFAPMPIAPILTKAINLIKPVIPRRIELSYTNNINDEKVNLVESRLIQSIINLCMNSVEAIPERGIINIVIQKAETLFGEFVEIYIADSGCGIDLEYIDEIFETFYTTKGDKGTGLGLTSVKKFVMDAGGFMDVESKVNEGTRFKISLPVAK